MQIQVEDLIKLIAYFSKEEELTETYSSIQSSLENISHRLDKIYDNLEEILYGKENFEDLFTNEEKANLPFKF